MGYLHHREIVHKDLKTKNIFLENGRAIITDFGLVNVARRLCARQHKSSFYGSAERYRKQSTFSRWFGKSIRKPSGFFKATCLYPGGIRSHDP
jgi:serine/threonine protein kinase